MPDGDPLRLVSHWRATEAFRQLPILLLADESELPRLGKGLDLGANDYLLRPVDRNELVARVRSQVRRKRLQDRLRENYRRSLSLALTDELTGLYNRRYVFAHLEESMARIGHDGQPDIAVMMFDVDHFKAVNANQYAVILPATTRCVSSPTAPCAACAASIWSLVWAARNLSW